MLKRTKQYGELVNLSIEPSDKQVNTQRSYVLAMAKDSEFTIEGTYGPF